MLLSNAPKVVVMETSQAKAHPLEDEERLSIHRSVLLAVHLRHNGNTHWLITIHLSFSEKPCVECVIEEMCCFHILSMIYIYLLLHYYVPSIPLLIHCTYLIYSNLKLT